MASGIYCSGEPRDQDKRENGMGVAVSSMRHEYMLFVRDTYVSDVNWMSLYMWWMVSIGNDVDEYDDV